MSQPISLTAAQFAQAQARLAAFLEDKYAIKNQSKGLMEYGAAVVLGYDNHHQLKASFSSTTDTLKGQSDDAIFEVVSAHSETIDRMLENRLAADFTAEEVAAHLHDTFQLASSELSEALLTRLVEYMNSPVPMGWEILYYASQADYEACRADFLIDDYILLGDVRHELRMQQNERPLPPEAQNNGGPVFKIQSNCREHIFVLSSKEQLDSFLSAEIKELL